jgi:hypothetical protein
MITRSPSPEAGAVFSDCESYRYLLWREWASNHVGDWGGKTSTVLWIMLNPSTADENVLDPTLRRCQGFTRSLGWSRFEVCNLFALRSTDPRALHRVTDPVGPDNDGVIAERMAKAAIVVVGWGAFSLAQQRVDAVLVAAERANKQLLCYGTTKGGNPRHPLYLRADAELQPWKGHV